MLRNAMQTQQYGQTIAFRVKDRNIVLQLKTLAKRMDLTKTQVIIKALKEFIERNRDGQG